jgi:hypothetical protein
MNQPTDILPPDTIARLIRSIRGQRVILDADLAALYGVQTFRLNEAVKRNQERFPEDFLFQLSTEERDSLTSQIAISKTGRGGRRTLPYAFTEHGALRDIYQKLRPLLEPPPAPPKPEIGFHIKEDALPYRIKRKSLRR